MAIQRLTIDGYGQLEINNAAFRRDGRIEAQCSLDATDFASTVAENGCGPAVAAMASSQAGGCLDMNTAIDKARKYTNNDGTSVQYFKDTLNASEINVF